jgi:3-isopropylmalate dehydrogenase
LLAGDGIGPEVVAEARKVLAAAARRFRFELVFEEALIGGAAIDATGTALPEETLVKCRKADAVLLGAVGGPQWDDPSAKVRPEQGLLGIRKGLGVFANLRPVQLFPELIGSSPLRPERLEGVDLVVVRELTGGLYFGERGRRPHPSGEQAFDTMIYATEEIERIVRLAGSLARKRRKKLASVDKANVLESSRLWRATVERVIRAEFPDVTLEHVLVDAAAMYLIQRPARFDVLVTENMFGDILTDEASVLTGSMGMLPSASLGSAGPGLYEPVHGSAPDIAGQGLANPLGAILSAAMMCRLSLGQEAASDAIEQAVSRALREGLRTRDLAPQGTLTVTTTQCGDRIADLVANA